MTSRHIVNTRTRGVSLPALTPTEETTLFVEWAVNAEENTRSGLRQAFKNEALSRIAASVPEWDSFEFVTRLASIWNMFGNAPNAAQTLARDIYFYTRDTAIPRVNSAPDQAALDAIDPTAADPFGDGTLWPGI